MAFLGQSYNTDDLPQGNSFDPVPDGWYNATISKAEVRDTKAGDGNYIAVSYTITGPTHEGRVIWGNLNLRNKNPKAEEIGRQQLGDVMRSIGLAKVEDSDQLVGGQLSIKLKTTKSEQYGDKNEVSGWRAIAGSAPPSSAASSSATGSKAPPWQKK